MPQRRHRVWQWRTEQRKFESCHSRGRRDAHVHRERQLRPAKSIRTLRQHEFHFKSLARHQTRLSHNMRGECGATDAVRACLCCTNFRMRAKNQFHRIRKIDLVTQVTRRAVTMILQSRQRFLYVCRNPTGRAQNVPEQRQNSLFRSKQTCVDHVFWRQLKSFREHQRSNPGDLWIRCMFQKLPQCFDDYRVYTALRQPFKTFAQSPPTGCSHRSRGPKCVGG